MEGADIYRVAKKLPYERRDDRKTLRRSYQDHHRRGIAQCSVTGQAGRLIVITTRMPMQQILARCKEV
jgi:hypothetical protein